MKIKFNQAVLIVIGIFSMYGHCRADGVYLPEARKKIPDIPIQRAILAYRNGIETLIIESSLNGDKSNYGWIIPVPNLPLNLGKVSPGLLKTLSLQLQPHIHYDPLHPKLSDNREIQFATLYTVLVLVGCLISMRWGAKRSIIPIVLIVSFMIWFPNYFAYQQKAYRSGTGFSSRVDPFIKIKDREVVGNYEIFVLEAQNSSKLNSWLADNGLGQFPPKATKLIDDYISQGWYFAAAKINTATDGVATPHPVLLKFESNRPVYPMKLTALPGSSLYLELYAVGDYELVPLNYALDKEYCNFFDYKVIPAAGILPELFDSSVYVPRKAFSPFTEIAHSGTSKVMWDACVVSKWTGTVASDDMKEDMFFEFKRAVPYQQQLYSPQAKFKKAYSCVLWIATIGAIILTIFYRIIRPRWNKPGMAAVWLLLMILCTAGFAYTYISLDETTNFYTDETSWQSHLEDLPIFLMSFPENTASSGNEYLEILGRNGIHNPITNEPIILENSPGNIVWEQTGDEIKIRYCRRNGSLCYLPEDRWPFVTPPR